MGNEGRGRVVSRHSRAHRGGFGVDGRPPLDAATRGGGATLTLLAARAYSIEHAPAFQRLSRVIWTRYPSFVPRGFEVRFSFSERNASIGFSHRASDRGSLLL